MKISGKLFLLWPLCRILWTVMQKLDQMSRLMMSYAHLESMKDLLLISQGFWGKSRIGFPSWFTTGLEEQGKETGLLLWLGVGLDQGYWFEPPASSTRGSTWAFWSTCLVMKHGGGGG